MMSANKKKIAIILVPGLMLVPNSHTSSLASSIWDQLQLQCKDNIHNYNVITNDFFQSHKSIHFYEIDWSSHIGQNRTDFNPFYQAFLTFKVFKNLLISIFLVFLNLLRSIINKQLKAYKSYIISVATTWSLMLYIIFTPLFSFSLLIVNLLIISSILHEFFKDTSNNLASNIDLISGYLFNFLQFVLNVTTSCLNFILNQILINFINNLISMFSFFSLSSILPSINNSIITNVSIILLIIIWIIGVALSPQITKVLEFLIFVHNYCQNELLRVQTRVTFLKIINSILLDPIDYQDIVIISHSFGSLLVTDLLANIKYSQKIKHYSFGNNLGLIGIVYYDFIHNIVEKVIRKYKWIDYYYFFDFYATEVPIFTKKKYTNFKQQEIRYYLQIKDWISLLSTAKFHLVYFLKDSVVKENKNKQSPLEEIIDDIYSEIS
ncbi:hypothetical protein cce_1716 [Crocosphaera subtropica ATCC 51142]|uniref:Uncharacterized protein n=1 Tax=Crocosphaera subtropica (strain ATCC 51142 / BH68) TaxID=43989 RepID=B1WYP9_CROS5|nr:hypothetical protein [Crocosphaera subtropica]ACB51066.1 hypothetical protein cce_1716 [Crocosphaera subtropica ATCC 51142]